MNDEEVPQQEPPVTETEAGEITEDTTLSINELEKLRQDATEYKDKYLRLLAESDNSRKRMQKERQEMTQFALQDLIVDFLDPIDHMENALKFSDQMSGEVKHWAIGFQMILSQFKDILANKGVFPIESVGKPFDPHIHEAIEMVEVANAVPGIVVEENVRGYKMGDRTIRPARVKVAK